MRRPFIADNWKMNKDAAEARELADGIREAVAGIDDVELAVFPPYLSIATVVEALKGSNVAVGAQNLFWEKSGAYTAEIPAGMIVAAGCSRVIVGHSVRRRSVGETDGTVYKWLKAARGGGRLPIMCCGEKLDERKDDVTKKVVETQVTGGLAGLSPAEMANVTVAYEPVWAIGTGETATPEQAEEVHVFIRGLLEELFGAEVAEATRIQYGGSVKPANVAELMACENIDGGLVGGASLEAESFGKLARLGRE